MTLAPEGLSYKIWGIVDGYDTEKTFEYGPSCLDDESCGCVLDIPQPNFAELVRIVPDLFDHVHVSIPTMLSEMTMLYCAPKSEEKGMQNACEYLESLLPK